MGIRDLNRVDDNLDPAYLGQVLTPKPIAHEMVLAALRWIKPEDTIRFMEPGFGYGAFFEALYEHVGPSRISSAVGFEIEPLAIASSRKKWASSILDLRESDFTSAELLRGIDDRTTLMLCNPPYVRHHTLQNEIKKRLQENAFESSRITLNGRSGLYCYFMLLAHKWLGAEGIAGWLLPSEFLGVDYSYPVRRYLTERVTLLRIHKFDNQVSLFDDASVTSVAIFYKNLEPNAELRVTITHGLSLASPCSTTSVGVELLRSLGTWNLLPKTSRHTVGARKRTEKAPPTIDRFFTVRRGIATGANGYFVVTPEQAEELELPREFLKPILPSVRHLADLEVIQADQFGNPLIPAHRFLIDCDLSEAEIQERYPSLWRYLELGKAKGIHRRYLCSHRQPWYSQERRLPAPILCKFMGNQTSSSLLPIRFILNRSQVLATNAYYLLYPLPWLHQVLLDQEDGVDDLWAALKTISLNEILVNGRSYGEGMIKFEPSSIGHLPLLHLSAKWISLLELYGNESPD